MPCTVSRRLRPQSRVDILETKTVIINSLTCDSAATAGLPATMLCLTVREELGFVRTRTAGETCSKRRQTLCCENVLHACACVLGLLSMCSGGIRTVSGCAMSVGTGLKVSQWVQMSREHDEAKGCISTRKYTHIAISNPRGPPSSVESAEQKRHTGMRFQASGVTWLPLWSHLPP